MNAVQGECANSRNWQTMEQKRERKIVLVISILVNLKERKR